MMLSGRKMHPNGVALTLSSVDGSRSVRTARGTNLPPVLTAFAGYALDADLEKLLAQK